MGIEISALGEIIKLLEENGVSLDVLRETLSTFKCKKNLDEEDFLRKKAIDYEKQNKARTYVLFNENGEIAGYFSLAFKSIDLKPVTPSKVKAMTAGESNVETYSAFLIGHIAKNDTVKQKVGNTILEMAENLLLEAQKIVGGRLVYLDCKDEPKLKEFYESNNYKYFNKSEVSGLLQYYKKL